MSGACRGCDRCWRSLVEAHCSTCHGQFSTVRNFDAHRVGGACLDPANVQTRAGNPRLRVVQRLSGPVWIEPMHRTFGGG